MNWRACWSLWVVASNSMRSSHFRLKIIVMFYGRKQIVPSPEREFGFVVSLRNCSNDNDFG